MRNALVLVGLFAGIPFAACSSSSTTPNGGGGSTSSGDAGSSANGDGGGSTNGDSGSSSCSCDINYNGTIQSVPCGQSGCINGSTFSCDSSGNSTKGGTCASNSGDSGASGCTLFTCNSTSDCGGVAPCFSTSTAGTNYCYEQEGEPSECSSGTTATTKTTSNGATTICVPSTCPQPVNYLP